MSASIHKLCLILLWTGQTNKRHVRQAAHEGGPVHTAPPKTTILTMRMIIYDHDISLEFWAPHFQIDPPEHLKVQWKSCPASNFPVISTFFFRKTRCWSSVQRKRWNSEDTSRCCKKYLPAILPCSFCIFFQHKKWQVVCKTDIKLTTWTAPTPCLPPVPVVQFRNLMLRFARKNS